MKKLLKKKGKKVNGNRSGNKVDKVKNQAKLEKLTADVTKLHKLVEEKEERDIIEPFVKLGKLVGETKVVCEKLGLTWYKYVEEHSSLNKARLDESFAAYTAHEELMKKYDELPEWVTKTNLIKSGQILLNDKKPENQEVVQDFIEQGVLEVKGEEKDVEDLSAAEVIQVLKEITKKKPGKQTTHKDNGPSNLIKKKPASVTDACSRFMNESRGVRDYFKGVKPAAIKTEKDLKLIEEAQKRAAFIVKVLKALYEAAKKNFEQDDEDEE